MWDAGQYRRYGDERARPFHELLARVGCDRPARVVDLGCGPGDLTMTLAGRWPQARVTGVDSSPDMVAAARERAGPVAAVKFEQADVRDWAPDGPVDVLVSNATLQWVPGHLRLLDRLAGWLAPGGWIAVQVPDNFGEPSHLLLAGLRRSAPWGPVLGAGADREAAVERPEVYLSRLVGLGLAADVWSTTYLHVLPGADPVLEWTKGTALRPVLAVLDPGESAEFLDKYAVGLRAAYPPTPAGTVFPFRRTFLVGHRAPATGQRP